MFALSSGSTTSVCVCEPRQLWMAATCFGFVRSLISKMRRTASQGDTRGAVEADFAFHTIVVDASGNWLLKQIWERLSLATTTFLTVSKSNRTLSEIAERHVIVLDALRSGDAPAAEKAMRAHIDEPGEWLRTAMEKAGSEE